MIVDGRELFVVVVVDYALIKKTNFYGCNKISNSKTTKKERKWETKIETKKLNCSPIIACSFVQLKYCEGHKLRHIVWTRDVITCFVGSSFWLKIFWKDFRR
jgi:hypothetical protein